MNQLNILTIVRIHINNLTKLRFTKFKNVLFKKKNW